MTGIRTNLCPRLKFPRISYKAAFSIDVMESTTDTKLILLFLLEFMLGFFVVCFF